MILVVALLILLLLLLLFCSLSSCSISVFSVCDEKTVPSSKKMELKSVSVDSCIRVSDCWGWISACMFSIGDASREVFVFSGMFVQTVVFPHYNF